VARRRHPENLAAVVGRNIKELRHVKGWSQEQLAEAADMDRSYVSGIEVGARNPSLRALERLARPLAVPPSGLFSG